MSSVVEPYTRKELQFKIADLEKRNLQLTTDFWKLHKVFSDLQSEHNKLLGVEVSTEAKDYTLRPLKVTS